MSTANSPTRLAAIAATAAVLLPVGCAAFRNTGPVDPDATRCRHFSCQGVTALERGDNQQAERLLRQAVGASPKDADARRHLAEALWARGDRDQAVSNLREALRLEPGCAANLCRLGQMESAAGHWDLAMRRAQQALHANPQLPEAWALRARAHRETGAPELAAADMYRALEFAPNDRSVLEDLAALYAQQGKPQRQLATIHRLQETYPHDEAPDETLVMEADTYAALGRPHDAVAGLRQAARRPAPSPALLYRLATAEEAIGQPAAAVAAAHRALAVDQGHLPSQQLLARLNQPNNRLH